MLRLRRINEAPAGGFCYVDKPSGFRAHGWSLSSVAAQWYHEQLRRGLNPSLQSSRNDVEQYTCRELMNTTDWQQWVEVVSQTPVYTPPPITSYQPTISVIIPAHKPGDRLTKVINSVLNQVNEVIVVGEDSNVVTWSTDSPKVRFLATQTGKETGFAEKCNLGAKAAKGDFLWFLNDDCYPNPDCGEKLLSVMNANPKIGIVGHLLRYLDGRIQHGGTYRSPDRVGFPHLDEGSLDVCTVKVPMEMEAVTAASMLVRREAFEEVAGFDEGYFLYLEDSDLCLKMRRNGWRVYYSPFAQGVHETHASSNTRKDLSTIIDNSVKRFTFKWSEYFNQPVPQFESFEKISTPRIDAVYVHLLGHSGYEQSAKHFVDSVVKFPPGMDLNWVVVLNTNNGHQLSNEMKSVFSRLGKVAYFSHDNSGWDIGAFQAYSRTSKAEFILFFGSTAYCRIKNWIVPIITAFRTHGANAIYGTCGNLGNAQSKVSPHLRTTGFGCTPQLFNGYPSTVTTPAERYPFEHGPNCLTMWAWSKGYQVYVVDSDSVSVFPDWNNNPEGYHRGTQKSLLLGDRVCAPPYTANP